jgi:C_GCAxxG_C_C family probable redox protein
MILRMTAKDVALRRFVEQGGNCAQAVLSAFGPELGLNSETCSKVAACFGAGIGRLGLTCGAVTGACMVLGLRHGHEAAAGAEGRSMLYGRVQDFTCRFRDRFGELECAALTGCDLTTPEGQQSFTDRGLLTNLCARLVAGAVEILEAMPGEPR